jgi:hypothetical protein
MSSSDAAWLIIWEWFATIGFAVVIAGVFIEGVEHFRKFPKKEKSRKKHIEKIGWFLVVAGLAAEFLGDHAAKRISDREAARLNREAGDARKIAGDAELEAGKANERAALIESNSLVLRSNVVALEDKILHVKNAIPPRQISEKQRQLFISTLINTNNVSPKIPIKVIVGENDKEAEDFAVAIRKMLTDSGYGTNEEQVVKIQNPKLKPTSNDAPDSWPAIFVIFATEDNGEKIPMTDGHFGFGSIGIFNPTTATISAELTNPNVPTVYRYTANPNDIISGICEIFDYMGFRCSEILKSGMLKPGEVGFYIPPQIQ